MPEKPYEEMGPDEIPVLWTRHHHRHQLSLYESPNRALWAVLNESRREVLLKMNTGSGAVTGLAQADWERLMRGEWADRLTPESPEQREWYCRLIRCPMMHPTYGCFAYYYTREGMKP